MSLAAEHRRRASSELERALAARLELYEARIPIRDAQWNRFVDRLRWLDPAVTREAEHVRRALSRGDFNALRSAAAGASSLLHRADGMLRAASMFDHPRRFAVVQLHLALGERCRRWLQALTGSDPGEPETARGLEVRAILADLRGSQEQAEDPWTHALGVSREQLQDQRGVVTVPLIVAAFHGRLDVLDRTLRELFGSLDPERLSAHKMLTYAQVLLDGFDPIEAVQAAKHVRDLLARQSASAPDHTTDVMAAMLEGVNRSYSNIKMILDDQRRITEVTEPETQARLRLDMYRRMAEGQFRPWAWTLVCLNTGATGSAPTLAQLADRLTSSRDDLASAFAECLAVGLRNDAAHEDVWWDTRRRALVGVAGDIDLDSLDALIERGHGLVGGAELGWALAFADMPDLAAATRKSVRTEPAMVLQVEPALTRFSTNGLKVEAWVSDLDTLTVTVREFDLRAVNPCAQAVLEMSLYLAEVERFEVRIAGRRGSVIATTRGTLRAVLPLWADALGRVPKMPPAVFLPVLAESRLQVEPPAVAVRAVARLALNEAVHCLDALPVLNVVDSSTAALLRECGQSLRLVASAFVVGIELTAGGVDTLVVRAQRAVEGAAVYALAAVDEVEIDGGREALARLARIESRIRTLWEGLPPVAPLPTLDPTPVV